MMAQYLDQIARLEQAISKLLKQVNELRNVNTELQQQLDAYSNELEGLKSVKKQEEQNNNFLNIAQHIKEKGSSDIALKEELARYLEYIDQCLELLNK